MTRLPHRPVSSQRRLRGRVAALTLAAATIAIAVTGCGGGDDPDADPTKKPSASTSEAPVVPITKQQAAQIKAKMPHERVKKLLGEPLLTQDPYTQFAGGCFYYAMENSLPADVWQFCFNDDGIGLVLTAYSPNQPPAPEDASYARGALIARADSVCQGQNGYLNTITNEIGNALADFGDDPNQQNTDALVREIGRFIKNLEVTHETLAAFNPPADKQDAYATYLDALADQVEALTAAQEAIADLDLETYDSYGTEFNDIGNDARTAAQDYGFTTCSAPDWG